MCGRYATSRGATDLGAIFEAVDETDARLGPTHNVAPTDPVPVVRVAASGVRTLSVARWGLLPSWARSAAEGARMINARVETVATSRAYARPFARRRCLVPADGWYEWVRRDTGGKQAYFLTPADGSVLAFAGIWSARSGATAPEPGCSVAPELSCSVLTTAAVGPLAEVHARMPVLLPVERWGAWLAPGVAADGLLDPPDERWLAGLEIRPVGPAVGDVRNDGPELTTRVPIGSVPSVSVTATEMTLF